MKIVGSDPGKGVNPVVGLREAKQHSHKATFPQDEFLGVLSASDVTSGFLDATNEEFEIIIGTRQKRLLQVIKQRRSKRDSDLLNVGHHTQ